jgi:hypothetical protein
MAVKLFCMRILHKLSPFVLPVLLAACISAQPYPSGVPLTQPANAPVMRAPQVGQEWVYNVRNVFNHEIIDVVTERVVSVGSQVKITRESMKNGRLPDEIQEPWGYVLQDPHWNPPQRFLKPIPLWPQQLLAGWADFFSNSYQVLGYPDNDYYWGLSMTARRWERVKVPAGEFNVLLYQNEIPMFASNDFARVANIRSEDVWLSPEIGRWVIRRSSGQYLWAGMSWGSALMEDYLQWELVSWK